MISIDNLGGNGHIQTLCAEKGLICVYPEKGGRFRFNFKPERLRIVSNGIEARIYKV